MSLVYDGNQESLITQLTKKSDTSINYFDYATGEQGDRPPRVAVFCEETKSKEAKESGAEFSNFESLIKDIENRKIKFDKLVATPAIMSKIGKLGNILGPKGLMPNPKLGTVTNDVKKAILALKSGQIEIKNDKDGNIGASIGKKSFTDLKIKENYNSIFETILKEKPSGIKGDYILSAFLTSTMGISYKLKLGK